MIRLATSVCALLLPCASSAQEANALSIPRPDSSLQRSPSVVALNRSPLRRASTRGQASAPLRRIAAANFAATREPTAGAFQDAIQVYPYADGVLYRLYASPERVSDIALQSGETLVSVASGDTARWTVGDTTSGSGAEKRTHILVKPFAAGLSTNLIITTDRRAYHLALVSNARTAMAALSWTYPADQLIALKRVGDAAQVARPVATGVSLEALRFDYRISGDQPKWRPMRAFDDGRQTFIEFPATLAQGEAPPLFIIGADGNAALVNYRLQGRYYVVDRLFDAAELRLGTRKQQIVRIARGPNFTKGHTL